MRLKARVGKLKNRKTAAADNTVDEFLPYGEEGIITMLFTLHTWTRRSEYTLKRWREGVVVNVSEEEARLACVIMKG